MIPHGLVDGLCGIFMVLYVAMLCLAEYVNNDIIGFAYVGTHIYETFGGIRGKDIYMQSVYYFVMMVVSMLRLGYDIITDIRKQKNK